jgi:hypothetical protein
MRTMNMLAAARSVFSTIFEEHSFSWRLTPKK